MYELSIHNSVTHLTSFSGFIRPEQSETTEYRGGYVIRVRSQCRKRQSKGRQICRKGGVWMCRVREWRRVRDLRGRVIVERTTSTVSVRLEKGRIRRSNDTM